MKRNRILLLLSALAISIIILYFALPLNESWCTTQIENREIRGETRETCLYESAYDSGWVRSRSWETRDRDYIYQEFYKKNTLQYSITYWNEDGKRCKEIKRINNEFVPEGVECG